VSGCAGDTRVKPSQHFWEFPFYRLALLGISTLPPTGRKKVTFQRFNRYRKPKTFVAGATKNILNILNRKFYFVINCMPILNL